MAPGTVQLSFCTPALSVSAVFPMTGSKVPGGIPINTPKASRIPAPPAKPAPVIFLIVPSGQPASFSISDVEYTAVEQDGGGASKYDPGSRKTPNFKWYLSGRLGKTVTPCLTMKW